VKKRLTLNTVDPADLPRDVGEMVYPVIWRGYDFQLKV
jgi:hypothetical protein